MCRKIKFKLWSETPPGQNIVGVNYKSGFNKKIQNITQEAQGAHRSPEKPI